MTDNLPQEPYKTILVAEDDDKTAALVALYLEREGFQPIVANDGKSAVTMAEKKKPDLVILDLMLPIWNGWEVCRRLREISDVPIIMLTARGEEVDRVAGLTMGADDYVIKPFSPRELVARVQAVLRRTAHRPKVPVVSDLYAYKHVVLDNKKRRLTVENKTVPLTPHEYALLQTLMAQPGRVFTRNELIDCLYPDGEAVVIHRVVDVHIGKLRQKIEINPSKPRCILTVRGMGYRFADDHH